MHMEKIKLLLYRTIYFIPRSGVEVDSFMTLFVSISIIWKKTLEMTSHKSRVFVVIVNVTLQKRTSTWKKGASASGVTMPGPTLAVQFADEELTLLWASLAKVKKMRTGSLMSV